MNQNQPSLALFQNEVESPQYQRLKTIEDVIVERQAVLDAINEDIAARKASVEHELHDLYTEANDVLRRLNKLKSQETQLRSELATERMSLDKKAETLQSKASRLLKL